MGDGDASPAIRENILAADILFIAMPICLGHPSSVRQRVLERFNARRILKDRRPRTPARCGKVAAVAVVGNKEGAHGWAPTSSRD